MKIFVTVLKVVAALAALAAIAFVIIAYGDKILAGAKKCLSKLTFWHKQEDFEEDPVFEG